MMDLLRKKIALWLLPELRKHIAAVPIPQSRAADLLLLAEILHDYYLYKDVEKAKHWAREIARFEYKKKYSGCSKQQYAIHLMASAAHWPSGFPWPDGIDRPDPTPSKTRAA